MCVDRIKTCILLKARLGGYMYMYMYVICQPEHVCTVSRIEHCYIRFQPPPLSLSLRTTVLAVGLVSSSFSVNEIDGSLRVGVVILSGHFESEQSVLISTQAGTATPGTWVLNAMRPVCGLVVFMSLPYNIYHQV